MIDRGWLCRKNRWDGFPWIAACPWNDDMPVKERAGRVFKGRMLNAANFVLPELAGSFRLLRAYSTLGRLRARSSPVKFMFEVINCGRCLTCHGAPVKVVHLSRLTCQGVHSGPRMILSAKSAWWFIKSEKCLQVPAIVPSLIFV